MPPGHPKRAKPLEWSKRASDAYSKTLAHISEEDSFAAQLVKERVGRALKQISEFPNPGTAAMPRGVRRFRIPNTGHVINYRVMRRTIRVQTWYRARQKTTKFA